MGIQYYDHECLCGCGQKIEVKSYHFKKGYKIPEYIRGHHNKTEKYKNKIKIGKSDPWNKVKNAHKFQSQNLVIKIQCLAKLENYALTMERKQVKKQRESKVKQR